jgi:HlyD family secretion protein
LAPEDVKLIFFLPEEILSKIKIGQVIKFGCDSCKTNYPATISFISSKSEYTPPVIYSRRSRDKLVYRIEAQITANIASMIHAGQPIDVFLKK